MHHLTPSSRSWSIRLAMTLPLMLMGSLPLFFYFQWEHNDLLRLMLFTLIMAQMILNFRTAALAATMMHRLRSMSGNWDLLALTGITARSLPRFVWWSVLRRTWIDHASLALPRLGVALGFVHLLFVARFHLFHRNSLGLPVRPFNYVSSNSGPFPEAYPDATQMLIAFVVLIIYAICEVALMTAVGVMWGTILARRRAIVTSVTMFIRIMVIFIAFTGSISLTFLMQRSGISTLNYPSVFDTFACESISRIPNEQFSANQYSGEQLRLSGRCDELMRALILRRAIESTQVTMFSFFDQGVLLSANIMRPIVINNPDNYRWYYFGHHWDNEWNRYTSYWHFVARNLMSAGLAVGIYAVMIGVSLYLAQFRLRRRGLLNE